MQLGTNVIIDGLLNSFGVFARSDFENWPKAASLDR